MGVQQQVQPMLFSFTYRITRLRYTQGVQPYKGIYVSQLYLQNHWLTQHLLVPYLKCNLCLYTLCLKSVGYNALIGVQQYLHRMFVSSSYRTTGLQFSLKEATLSSAYVCKLFLENYLVTLHLQVSNLKCNLFLLALPLGLLGHTKLISALSQVQTYECPIFSAAYICKLYLLNKSFPLNLWIRQFKSSLGLLAALLTE